MNLEVKAKLTSLPDDWLRQASDGDLLQFRPWLQPVPLSGETVKYLGGRRLPDRIQTLTKRDCSRLSRSGPREGEP